MITLVEFLEARLAEDERHARAAGWHRWEVGDMTTIVATGNGKIVAGVDRDYDARFIARHDPARVLREVAAKRRMLIEVDSLDRSADVDAGPAAFVLLRLLAAPYSDHPDYQAEWSPS